MIIDEVVPGLYYAADSAATIDALKRPGAADLPRSHLSAVIAPARRRLSQSAEARLPHTVKRADDEAASARATNRNAP